MEKRGITRRVLSSLFGRKSHNEARLIPVNVVNSGHNEARLIPVVWEKQGVMRRIVFSRDVRECG